MTGRRAPKRRATEEGKCDLPKANEALVANKVQKDMHSNATFLSNFTNRLYAAEDDSSLAILHIPQFIKEFYAYAESFCDSDPCTAFKGIASSRLIGLFDAFRGGLSSLDENQLRLHCRHATDLPEMQTIFVCEIGRYCLWRDVPKSEEGWIVYVNSDGRFPKMEIIGNRMEHIIVHLASKVKTDAKTFLPKSADLATIKHEMKSACAIRNKSKLGKAPNGAGLWVEVIRDVGYRPIPEDAAKIRNYLELICDTNDNILRQKKMKWLMELVTSVQYANDECDFGMGLELGYWLFLANHPSLDKIAYRILSTAYTLLGRLEYKAVLDAQMAPGVRRRTQLDMRTQMG